MKRLEGKLESVQGGGFVAVASTDALDSDNKRIAPGAFNPLPTSVPILVGHDYRGLPIGKGRAFYSGNKLMIDAQLATTDKAEEVRQLAAGGFIDSVSVGFTDPVRDRKNGETWVTKARLRELSIVVFGANDEARLVSVRAMDPREEMQLVAAKARIDALEADIAALPRLSKRTTEPSLARAYATLADVSTFLSNLDRKR